MAQINETLRPGSSPANSEEVLAQIDRINSSPLFRNSPLLQSFLRTIAQKAVTDSGSEINEYFVATQVFSRTADFDPSVDTIVRTQAYRLRLKLEEYYRTAGQSDELIIEVPKGHYVPVFRRSEPTLREEPPEMNAFSGQVVRPKHRRRPILYLLVAAAGLFLFVAGRWSVIVRPASSGASAEPLAISAMERSFWETFLAGDRQPLVAYTNAQFLGNDNGDLLRFTGGPVGDRGTRIAGPEGIGSPLYFIDDMTGVGEVLGSVAIVNTLASLGVHPSFKRSRLVTAFDLKNHNVIFLGSPSVNPILKELPVPPAFGFIFTNARPYLWRSHIENYKPAPGELASFRVERDPGSGVLRTDYATLSLLPGIAPGRHILVLAGLTTSGTQAAAEAVTSSARIKDLLDHVGVGSGTVKRWPVSFQSVWRADLSRGVDVVRLRLAAARTFAEASESQ